MVPFRQVTKKPEPKFWKPQLHQEKALKYGIERLLVRPMVYGQQRPEGIAYFMEPGLGKTSTVLALLCELRKAGFYKKALLLAPSRVCTNVWPRETEEWLNFQHLKVEPLCGLSEPNRVVALRRNADIYAANPQGTEWVLEELVRTNRIYDFDTLILDESTAFKGSGSKRVAALARHIKYFRNRMILTGTPMPNSIEDLWSQVGFLDNGRRLGTNIKEFRDQWCYLKGGGMYQSYATKDGAVESVQALISDICLYLSAADYLNMPELIENDVYVSLPPEVMADYLELQQLLVTQLQTLDGSSLSFEASTPGAVYSYCRQLANGGVYIPTQPSEIEMQLAKQRVIQRVVAHTHKAKVDAVKEIAGELNGRPLLVAVSFRHDYERLCRAFNRQLPAIMGGTSAAETNRLVALWNEGRLPILVGHPEAMGHGLNMQAGPGRDIAWMGLPDKPELYKQMNARLWRNGVGGSVRVHRILADATVDLLVAERLKSKDLSQESLLMFLRSSLLGV